MARVSRGALPISTHIVAPCFLTFLHRVRSKTFEGGFDAPRFLSSELFVGNRIDRVCYGWRGSGWRSVDLALLLWE